MQLPAGGTRVSELEGRQLGSYQLVEIVGRGGMAVVYKALQANLRRHVAVKVLPPYFLHELDFRARFQQEAETIARLEHPNILPIYDYGQQDDILYIVMPLVTGGTLRSWMGRAVSLDRAIQVFSRLLSALENAHGQNVIHRDIKPSNVLMSQADWPLLADFGIAKLVEPSVRATHPGTIVGTPEYMAPEQSEGISVDHRADLYAMGAILFQMLTGRLPFEGQSPMAVILQHVRDTPPLPSALRPELHPAWDAVMLRALAKNPADRFPSARAFDDAVQAALQAELENTSQPHGTIASSDPSRLYASASRALVANEYERAISLCQEVLRLQPTHAQAARLLAEARAAHERDLSTRQTERALEYVAHGDRALAVEEFAEARRWFETALTLAPETPTARHGLARTQRAEELASLYQHARADIAAQRWAAAAAKLDTLQSEVPYYRDVDALRTRVSVQLRAVTPLPGDRASASAPNAAGTAGALAWGGTANPPRDAPTGRYVEPAADPRSAAPRLAAVTYQGPSTPVAGTARPVETVPAAVPALPMPAERGGGLAPKIAVAAVILAVLVVGGALMLPRLRPGETVAAATSPRASATATTAASTASETAPAAPAGPTAAERWGACNDAVADRAWASAAAACEAVRGLDPAFPGLANALVATYVGLGRDQLALGAPIQTALDYFERAVEAQSTDAEANAQRDLALAYRDGEAAVAAGDWPTSVARLETVYAAAPDYLSQAASGGVGRLLYTARTGWGEALLASRDYGEAQRRCSEALDLVVDGAEARRCRESATEALRPPTAVPAAAGSTPANAGSAAGRSAAPSGGTTTSGTAAGQRPAGTAAGSASSGSTSRGTSAAPASGGAPATGGASSSAPAAGADPKPPISVRQ